MSHLAGRKDLLLIVNLFKSDFIPIGLKGLRQGRIMNKKQVLSPGKLPQPLHDKLGKESVIGGFQLSR